MSRYRKPIAWLSKEQISKEADDLLAKWSDFMDQKASPPIPVEAIAEKYLGITLEYDDLSEILGIPDVLGATWVDEKRIVINKSLATEKEEGRLNFTCGHEIGHWVLHRQFLSSNDSEPAVICRTSQAKSREEWQADYFSSCLLMPEEELREAYHGAFGSQPLILNNEKSCFGKHAYFLDPALDSAREIAHRVRTAGNFINVSKEALCYRLQELCLIQNRTNKSLSDFFRKKGVPSRPNSLRRTLFL
jgi:Zn-dependent peptidase ImmA (M78 family)